MSEQTATKICPFCAETIKAAAIVCRYCGRDLTQPLQEPKTVQRPKEQPAPSAASQMSTAQMKKFEELRDVESNRRKNNVFVFVILFALVGCALVWNSLSDIGRGSTSSSFRPRATEVPANAFVIYEVNGSARSVDLVIENQSGGTEMIDSVPLSYKKTFAVPRGQFVYLSAQNNGKSGMVQCRITVDGRVLETASSSGEYVIATCSGSTR